MEPGLKKMTIFLIGYPEQEKATKILRVLGV